MRLSVGLLGLALVASPAAAQAPLTLESVYADLDATHPRLQAAAAEAEAARARIRPAGRWPDPTVQFALMNRSLPGLGQAQPLGMNQVTLMQMVPVAGKTGLSVRAARAGAEAEADRAREARLAVRAEGARRFFALYETEGMLAVTEQGRGLLAEALRASEAGYAQGLVPQAAVLRAQVEVARMDEMLLRLRAMRRGTAGGLNALRGRPLDQPVAPARLPGFPDSLPSRDSLETWALGDRPALAAGARDVEAQGLLATRAGREIWPDLTLGVTYGQRSMPSGGTDRMASFMLGFALPIAPGRLQHAMRDEALARQAAARADLDAMRLETRDQVSTLSAEADQATATATLYRTTLLPQLEAAAASALAGFRRGLVDFTTLIESDLALVMARQELVRLDAGLGRALAELEALTATPLLRATPTGADQ